MHGPATPVLPLARGALLLAVTLSCARLPAPGTDPDPRATHGIAVGDVTATSAVVWARTGEDARMHVVATRVEDGERAASATIEVGAESDFAGIASLEGLRPATAYQASVHFEAPDGRRGASVLARFRTAPAPDEPAAARLAWGGDVAGQNVCRALPGGFPILPRVRMERPDLFVALGDWIYADDTCRPVGRYGHPQEPGPPVATDLDGYRAHWRYVRADPALQALLAETPWVAVWDDHEVVNDSGPQTDSRDEPPYRSGVPLMPLGRRAFREWNPIAPRERLHRTLRWGRHLELFVLDTRSYREPNFAPDDGPQPKSMLGLEQRRWLVERLTASDATWKVIVSSVPLSIPTGSPAQGRDGWADLGHETGFERELLAILAELEAGGVRNLLWITTDVHFAAAFRYAPFSDAPAFRFLEIATGPLHAGLFPNPRFDATLGTRRLFLYGPERAEAVSDLATALRWFNFGVLEIDAAGALSARIVNGEGETVFRLTLDPQPAGDPPP